MREQLSSIERIFNKVVNPILIHKEIDEVFPNIVQTIVVNAEIVKIYFTEELSEQDDIALLAIINNHIPTSSLLEEETVTSERMKEGFSVYQKIFSHISDTSAIANIDSFLLAYPQVLIFRCLMKDGQNESALRFMETVLKPLNLFPDYDLYKTWIRDNALKYNPPLAYNCGLINPAFIGTPFENIPMIDYIEQAPSGQI